MRITSYTSGTDISVHIATYPDQPPIGWVHLAGYNGVRIDVDAPAEARAIAAAFNDMADQLEAAMAAQQQCAGDSR